MREEEEQRRDGRTQKKKRKKKADSMVELAFCVAATERARNLYVLPF